LFISLILAHIYIGTLGMEGAFEAMAEGTVDVNWAKEHHSHWFDEMAHRAANEIHDKPSPALAE
jgi:formate dehydrogenase subunit gamma